LGAPPEPCPCRDDVCLSVAAAVGWAALCVLAGAALALACARAAAACNGNGDDDGGHGGGYAEAGRDRGAAAAQLPSASAPPQILLSEPLLALRPVPSDGSLASLAPDGSGGVPSSTSFTSSPVLRAVPSWASPPITRALRARRLKTLRGSGNPLFISKNCLRRRLHRRCEHGRL